MGFRERQKQETGPVTGQLPTTGFFMPISSSSDGGLGVIRSIFFTFFRFPGFSHAHFNSEFRIGVCLWEEENSFQRRWKYIEWQMKLNMEQ